MPEQDLIEIEQNGRILRGRGTLRVTAGEPGQGGWRKLPTVRGVVTFEGHVTIRDLEAMTDAEVRVTQARGGSHTLTAAVMMNPNGGPAYTIHLDCYGPVTPTI